MIKARDSFLYKIKNYKRIYNIYYIKCGLVMMSIIMLSIWKVMLVNIFNFSV